MTASRFLAPGALVVFMTTSLIIWFYREGYEAAREEYVGKRDVVRAHACICEQCTAAAPSLRSVLLRGPRVFFEAVRALVTRATRKRT